MWISKERYNELEFKNTVLRNRNLDLLSKIDSLSNFYEETPKDHSRQLNKECVDYVFSRLDRLEKENMRLHFELYKKNNATEQKSDKDLIREFYIMLERIESVVLEAHAKKLTIRDILEIVDKTKNYYKEPSK